MYMYRTFLKSGYNFRLAEKKWTLLAGLPGRYEKIVGRLIVLGNVCLSSITVPFMYVLNCVVFIYNSNKHFNDL